MKKFELVSPFKPSGDQQQAIDEICEGLNDGLSEQVLLGVTGSGKTFTMANVIAKMNRPCLVLAHNKTLASQLCNEFKQFFPNNRVEFYVSYYDYYQPEAYISSTDTYIEKDISTNEEIEKLRHSATASLMERRDVIVVSSVSCIYGLGDPKSYFDLQLSLRLDEDYDRKKLIKKLLSIQYMRNDIDFQRGTFRIRGDVIDVYPIYSNTAYRLEFFGDTLESIKEIDALTSRQIASLTHVVIFPATHYALGSEHLNKTLEIIKRDAEKEVNDFISQNKLIEAQRLKERTNYDLEMIKEMGYCSGVENYSKYFDERETGEPPFTLLDYFPKDFILFVDESHITLPQVRGMYNGDRARKTNLVNYGFRLKSALDNRPLNFDEFNSRIGQVVYVSATPGEYEKERAGKIVEQIIRPTGLLDPMVEVRPVENQINDLYFEIKKVIETDGRVLVTTLTKKMSELLTDYFSDEGLKVKYLHSDIDTLERMNIINALRRKEFDVLIGINLLREGLDIPEVKLVAILDADKEGFLRSSTSLIQIIGRAARNSEARVIMYADNITDSMKYAIDETERRRKIQDAYNKENGIIPKTIQKKIVELETITKGNDEKEKIKYEDIPKRIAELRARMNEESAKLNFELAIEIREKIKELEKIKKNLK